MKRLTDDERWLTLSRQADATMRALGHRPSTWSSDYHEPLVYHSICMNWDCTARATVALRSLRRPSMGGEALTMSCESPRPVDPGEVTSPGI